MNITYDWKITAMKKAPVLEGLSDVITKAITQKVTPTNVDADMPWAPEEKTPE
jgi:hypothetical protein